MPMKAVPGGTRLGKKRELGYAKSAAGPIKKKKGTKPKSEPKLKSTKKRTSEDERYLVGNMPAWK